MPTRRQILKYSMLGLAGGLLAACQTPQVVEVATLPPQPTPTAGNSPKVLIEQLDFPEGPAFAPDGSLWCCELQGRYLVSWTNGLTKRYNIDGSPNGLEFDRKGRAWVCDSEQNAIRRFDPVTNKWETMVSEIDGRPLQTPNDLAFDSQGNLLFTCPNFETVDTNGYIGCLRPDGQVVKVADGFNQPNGLAFIDQGATLVIDDTYTHKLYQGAWDPQKMIWNKPLPFAEVSEGSNGPDGMYPGADGLLYVAIYGAGQVLAVDKDGNVKQTIETPGKNPTNVAVDPSGKLGLVVTETDKGVLLSYPWIQPGATIYDGGDAWS